MQNVKQVGIDRVKAHRIVEYIKHRASWDRELPFDQDEAESRTAEIVASYGFDEEMTEAELSLVREELVRLADDFQTSEVIRQAALEANSDLHAWIDSPPRTQNSRCAEVRA